MLDVLEDAHPALQRKVNGEVVARRRQGSKRRPLIGVPAVMAHAADRVDPTVEYSSREVLTVEEWVRKYGKLGEPQQEIGDDREAKSR